LTTEHFLSSCAQLFSLAALRPQNIRNIRELIRKEKKMQFDSDSDTDTSHDDILGIKEVSMNKFDRKIDNSKGTRRRYHKGRNGSCLFRVFTKSCYRFSFDHCMYAARKRRELKKKPITIVSADT
jgi:hypothetical protein